MPRAHPVDPGGLVAGESGRRHGQECLAQAIIRSAQASGGGLLCVILALLCGRFLFYHGYFDGSPVGNARAQTSEPSRVFYSPRLCV